MHICRCIGSDDAFWRVDTMPELQSSFFVLQSPPCTENDDIINTRTLINPHVHGIQVFIS